MSAISRKLPLGQKTDAAIGQDIPQSHPVSANALDLIALVNADGIVTYASPAITSLLGYSPDELIGRGASDLVHPDEVESIHRVLDALEQLPDKSPTANVRLRCKDGSWRTFEASAINLLRVPGVGAIAVNFREVTKQQLAPDEKLSDVSAPEHVVQFYETEDYLLDTVSRFIGAGLDAGEGCVAIGTQAHGEHVEERLRAGGWDLVGARARGEYLWLDAAEMLALFMVDGLPVAERFAAVVGRTIARAAEGRRHVRIFGEMVALLWAEGNQAAAIQLEELWNELRESTADFTLFCAYPMDSFAGEMNGASFAEICQRHSQVIPDERYTALANPDERLRAIAVLQQQAGSLEQEIVERRRAEARFRFVAESMPQKIFTAGPSGGIDYFNPQWMEFTGLSFDAMKDWGWIQVIHPEDVDEHVRRWQRAIERGEPFYFEHRFRGADGVYRWHVSRAIPMRDEAGSITMWIGSSTDIDEQKQQEERKNAFISMASHELKTPVTSLKGFTQVLRRRLQRQADVQTLLFLDRMDAQLTKLTGLISDLLDVSKMQTGTLPFREARFDLDDLVRETVENVQAATTTHQLSVRGETHAQVFGDQDRLGQVLINLLANAIKYSPKADRVVVWMRRHEDQVEVDIQDFGIGIAEEHHQRIFERFYQVTDPRENTYPGLGIGLFIARAIVERHGGRLWLESRKEAGSTFCFSLPLADTVHDVAERSARGEAVS